MTSRPSPSGLELAVAAKAREAVHERLRAEYWQGISTGIGVIFSAFLAVLVIITFRMTRAPMLPAAPTSGQFLCDGWRPTGRQCGNGGCEWQRTCYECDASMKCEVLRVETTCIGSSGALCPSSLPAALPEPERWTDVETDWLRDDGLSLSLWIGHP